jgi:hypothetical protein
MYTVSWENDPEGEGHIQHVRPEELGAVVAAAIRDKGGYRRTVRVHEEEREQWQSRVGSGLVRTIPS